MSDHAGSLYPLFEHMAKEHGLTLLESELADIVDMAAVCRGESISGTVVLAGTDPETGKPRVVVETKEEILGRLRFNIMFKPCTVAVPNCSPAAPNAGALTPETNDGVGSRGGACPFCGSAFGEPLGPNAVSEDGQSWSVVCACGAAMRGWATKPHAIAAWYKRAK